MWDGLMGKEKTEALELIKKLPEDVTELEKFIARDSGLHAIQFIYRIVEPAETLQCCAALDNETACSGQRALEY